ncbi:hypothetical protein CLV98_11140 [Dyadobacter jejuensis]|uniref:Uncharacterized protein n=1 Tax=Dyadobacter jejuensis TaxID=1082580 RepID=A0A316AFI3_9BACT|nr:peptidase M10 [Dyadobacter jejuensis]PWJ56546.1 hypothetical protein CLV98_11140 [Dyadobacter jejuensis]
MAAEIHYRASTQRIEVLAHLFFYGQQATTQIGAAIETEINRLFNEPQVSFPVRGQQATVHFTVTQECVDFHQVQQLARHNTDYKNNFIRIEAQNLLTRSFMGFGLGDNAGHWITSDELGFSTTATHEFGHGLGLDHPAHPDFRGSGSPPPIMAARGSLVDAPYQWNPLAQAGAYGGTMKPIYRRVTAEEVRLILEGLTFANTDTYLLGHLSNRLFDPVGRVIPI